MKKKIKLLLLVPCILLAGCATPSKVIEKFSKGELVERIVEYDNSTFASAKAVGIKVGYDPTTYSPVFMILYGRYESGRVKNGMWYDSDYGLNDINILTGQGTAEHHIRVGPAELYEPIMNDK